VPLTLGTSGRRGRSVTLTDEERSRHVQVIGASGTGKSKFLESLVRQDILAGRGLCLIDPHGTLADDVVAWCASRSIDTKGRHIHVITPSDLDWSAGFNPLRLDTVVEPQARVDAMVAACAQVWGGEDLAATPLLKRCLKAVFYVLAVRELTLVEAVDLVTAKHAQSLRRALTHDLPDRVVDAQWNDWNAMSARDFLEQFGSTSNRLMEFLSSPVMRRVVGQRNQVLDLARAMDEREIVIVNLAQKGAISQENGRLLGTLLTSELFLLAKNRSPERAKQRPFTLYIDECYQFITSDIEQMLDQTRKFGLHVVLSHQRLGQLGDRNGPLYNGVMAGAQTKVVFGGMADDDAEQMAREVFRGSFNLERPKHSLDRLTVVDEVPFWLDSESQTESEGTTSSSNTGGSWSRTSGTSEGGSDQFRGDDLDRYGRSEQTGRSESSSEGQNWGESSGTSSGWSSSRGRSQSFKPVRVLLPTTMHTLEEEIHLAIVKLRSLPKQTAILKRPERVPVRLRPPTVKAPLVRPEAVAAFVERTRAASDSITPSAEVEAEMRARRAKLSNRPPPEGGGDPFWVEEES
jgi:hypothetical protein